MKKFAFLMISIILMFAGTLSATASMSAPAPDKEKESSTLPALVPSSFIVEQTATLSSGESVTVYYKKNGNDCEVYSEYDLKDYSINDLPNLKSTGFRLVNETKGKCL